MYKKEDPRKIRTKEMFKQAVLTLLQEGYLPANLTIQKVAEQAGLNRSTFYLHYEDIYDLLSQIQQEIMEAITKKIEALKTEGLSQEKKLIQLLDYLYTIRREFPLLFQTGQMEAKLFTLINELINTRREISEVITKRQQINSEIKAASLVGIIMWWLKNGLHYSSEYIAKQINDMYK